MDQAKNKHLEVAKFHSNENVNTIWNNYNVIVTTYVVKLHLTLYSTT